MKQLPPAGRWIAFVAVLSACSSEEKVPSQNLAAVPNVVSLTATEYAFQAPDTIPAGWTTLRMANRGPEIHYGHIVRLVRLMDFSFALDSVVPAGRHTVRVENAGMEPHDLVVLKLAPGTTVADLMAVMNPERARRPGQAAEPPPPPESLPTGAGGIAAIAPGWNLSLRQT